MNHSHKKILLILFCFFINLFFCIDTYAKQEQIKTKSFELKNTKETNQITSKIKDFEFNKTKEIYYIFIGDSRTVGTDKIINNENSLFIGKVGSGYKWFESYVIKELEKLNTTNKQVVVVSWFGINDLGNIEKYIDIYNNLIEKHKDWLFVFPSIGEVEESIAMKYNYSIHNQDIISFNKQLKNNFSYQYLDISSIFLNNEFSLDGVHYKEEIYKSYYDLVVSYTKNFFLLNEYDCMCIK